MIPDIKRIYIMKFMQSTSCITSKKFHDMTSILSHCTETSGQLQRHGFFIFVIWVRISVCMFITPRYFTCLLNLQGVQWIRELVVVRVSWPGHPGLKKKKYFVTFKYFFFQMIYNCKYIRIIYF